MNLFVTLMLGYYLKVCDFGYCKMLQVEPEVIAVASCESGDGLNFGTIDWSAVSETNDTGAFQFNDATWELFNTGHAHAKDAPQAIQIEKFYQLWNHGWGWKHWKASKGCWGQWISVKNGRAVWKSGQ